MHKGNRNEIYVHQRDKFCLCLFPDIIPLKYNKSKKCLEKGLLKSRKLTANVAKMKSKLNYVILIF